MKKWISLLLVVILALGLCACGGETAKNPEHFSVGYAKTDITPGGSVPLAGTGNYDKRLSNQVLDKLYAVCIAFADTQGNRVLLFTLDMLNSYENVIYPLRIGSQRRPVCPIVMCCLPPATPTAVRLRIWTVWARWRLPILNLWISAPRRLRMLWQT